MAYTNQVNEIYPMHDEIHCGLIFCGWSVYVLREVLFPLLYEDQIPNSHLSICADWLA